MAELIVKRRPIRAALYGLMLGFSIWYFMQFQFATFSFDSVGGILTRAIIVIVVVMALSVAWAYLAPPKKPKEAAPADAAEPAAVAAPQAEGAEPALPSEDE